MGKVSACFHLYQQAHWCVTQEPLNGSQLANSRVLPNIFFCACFHLYYQHKSPLVDENRFLADVGKDGISGIFVLTYTKL